MLFDRRPLLTLITDKIRVRDYVAQQIGPTYLTRLHQVCRTPQQIDWQALPPRFVIKANHGSGMVVIVDNKSRVNLERLFQALERGLHINRYYNEVRGEWSYRDIVPSLLIEERLTNADGKVPADFKFFVFDGRAVYLQVDVARFSDHRRNFYDRDLNQMNVKDEYPPSDKPDIFPENIHEMFALADRLGRGFDFVRVDLYNVAGRIVFGELTNYPGAGRNVFDPSEYDKIFGAQWRLPASYQLEARAVAALVNLGGTSID